MARPSNGFECFLDLQASLVTRRWSVSQEPLEPHLGTQHRSKNRASKGSTTYTLWNRFRTALRPDFGSTLGAMLGPSWPHVRPKEGYTVRGTPLLCCIRVKWPSWSPLGALLEPSWAPLGALLAPLGALLGPSWGLLGQFRSVLEPFGGPPQGSR